MSEAKRIASAQDRTRKEQEWTDQQDGQEEDSSPYEPCYRDGTVKHECWHDS